MAAQQREKEETELKVPDSINPLCSQTLPVPAPPPPPPHATVTRSSEISDLKLSGSNDSRSSSGISSERIDLKNLNLFATEESRSISGREKIDLTLFSTDESRSKLSSTDESRSSSIDLKVSGTYELRSNSGSSTGSIDLKLSSRDESRPSSGSSIDLKVSGMGDELRSTSAKSPENTDVVSRKRQREANRCCGIGCRRKVGLMPFRCRCGDVFCSEHRYSDRHDCSYDYKAAGREAIARENPVVKAAKILKV